MTILLDRLTSIIFYAYILFLCSALMRKKEKKIRKKGKEKKIKTNNVQALFIVCKHTDKCLYVARTTPNIILPLNTI